MAVVNIPNPCPLKLNQLTPVAGGFHCDQCGKTVIDFRGKPDEEVISTLAGSENGRVCGVYQPHQVNAGVKPSFQLLKFVASLFLAFGMSLFAACDNDVARHTIGDSMRIDSVAAMEQYAQLKADSVRIADSMRIGDSIASSHADTGIIVNPKRNK
jgi:hypothetical protein